MSARRQSYPAQTSSVTCGAAAIAALASRHGLLPWYAESSDTTAARVQSRLHDAASRAGLPWPKMLGTAPWAASLLVSRAVGHRCGVFGWLATSDGPRDVNAWDGGARVEWLRQTMTGRLFGRDSGAGALIASIDSDSDCLLYVGGSDRLGGVDKYIPRHVVAVLGKESNRSGIRMFEPSQGLIHDVPIRQVLEPSGRPLPAFGRWRFPLLTVASRS